MAWVLVGALAVALAGLGCPGYGLYRPPGVGQPEVVAVHLRPNAAAAWPALISAGPVVFELTNGDALAHGLELVGPTGQHTPLG